MSEKLNLNAVLKKMKKYGLAQLSVDEMEILEKYYRKEADKKKNLNSEENTQKKIILNEKNKTNTKVIDKDIFDIFSQMYELIPKKYHYIVSKYQDKLEDEIDNYNEILLFGVEDESPDKYINMLLEDMFSELEENPNNFQLKKATVLKCASERDLLFLIKLLKTHENNIVFKSILLKSIARKLKLIENSSKEKSIKEKLDKFNEIELKHLISSIKETGGEMFKISQLERVFHAIGDKEIKVKDVGLPQLAYMFKRYLLKASQSDAKTIFSVLKKLNKKTLATMLNACTKDKKFVSALKLNQMTVIRMIQNHID